MNTLDGTCNTAVLLLETVNVKPPDGATDPATRLIEIVVGFPPTTVDGFADTSP